ncbi:MAG: hypothetical protein V4598_10025 [Bdellovibrionota bacterium]
MHYFLLLLLVASCSTEKKYRTSYAPSLDNEERISHDWNGDGYPEIVMITPVSSGGEYRELRVYRGVPDGANREIIFTNRSLVPRRAKPGATLKLQKDHSFYLTVDSSGSGRDSDVITWKISWKQGRYLLTGIVRDWQDKLDPHDHKSCDVDLRVGRGKKNGKHVKFVPLSVDLIDLNERFIPAICEF